MTDEEIEKRIGELKTEIFLSRARHKNTRRLIHALSLLRSESLRRVAKSHGESIVDFKEAEPAKDPIDKMKLEYDWQKRADING
jgi:hypothetical protein